MLRFSAPLIAFILTASASITAFGQSVVMNVAIVQNRPFLAAESHSETGHHGTVTHKIARNAEGSLSYESPDGTIYIFDVPNKTRTTIFEASKHYRVDPMPQLSARMISDEYVARLAAHIDDARAVHVEQNGVVQDRHSLGTKTIQGFVAFGHLTTFKGTDAQGNTVDKTEETWESPLVGLLSHKTEDHVSGNSSTTLRENFQMTEPDQALFQIPSGYTPERSSSGVKQNQP